MFSFVFAYTQRARTSPTCDDLCSMNVDARLKQSFSYRTRNIGRNVLRCFERFWENIEIDWRNALRLIKSLSSPRRKDGKVLSNEKLCDLHKLSFSSRLHSRHCVAFLSGTFYARIRQFPYQWAVASAEWMNEFAKSHKVPLSIRFYVIFSGFPFGGRIAIRREAKDVELTLTLLLLLLERCLHSVHDHAQQTHFLICHRLFAASPTWQMIMMFGRRVGCGKRPRGKSSAERKHRKTFCADNFLWLVIAQGSHRAEFSSNARRALHVVMQWKTFHVRRTKKLQKREMLNGIWKCCRACPAALDSKYGHFVD